MNLPKIQSLIAPLSAPVPSATAIAAQVFNELDPTLHWSLAGVAALAAFIGIETVGGASCYATVKLHRQKNYGIEFFVSLAGIFAYVATGLWVLHEKALVVFFILAPFSYFAYAILRSMTDEHQEKVTETEAQIALINAQRLLVNAEKRKLEAKRGEIGGEKREILREIREMSAKSEIIPAKEDRHAAVRRWLQDDPNLSGAEIGRRLGLSPRSGQMIKKEVEENAVPQD